MSGDELTDRTDRWPSATRWARIDDDGVVVYAQTQQDRERRAYQP